MSSDLFHNKIQIALDDPNLQAALDANAERRINARQQAYTSLPEPIQEMRQEAHRVRADVIAHLDTYLAQFIAQAQANGMIIHRAASAREAVKIVLEIAKANQVKLVATSKTMVSEEIHLNHALENAGYRVVETDLGEYIVQLRGEKPAHIITPAVHLRRADVGRTFHEKLGIPETDDIPTLTTVARRMLRQVFLEADMGVSGVNFGVAESGTLCIVTNEGNGRMVTTLPRVHVALMGIERLVPNMQDLGLMLYLLPRSATGQKLTVYTSLINGPRRPDESQGPLQRHIILVDNGREAMRHSPLAEALLCIRCGACLNACPVFREIGGHGYVNPSGESSTYPGPIGSVVSPGLFGQSEFGQLARASSLCGACKEACPVDIDLPKLLLRVRAGQTLPLPEAPTQPAPALQPNAPVYLSAGLKLYTWMASSPRRFALAQRLAGLFGRLAAPASGWIRLPAPTGWGASKDFPRPAEQSFRQRYARRQTSALSGHNRAAAEPVPAVPAQKTPAQFETQTKAERAEQAGQAERAELVRRFASELTTLGGVFVACKPDELAAQISTALQQRGIQSISAWAPEHLPDGLLESLQAKGLSIQHDADPAIRAGLTSAIAAAAETGSLALPGGAGQYPSASLLVETHIAVLRAGDIYASVPEVLALPALRKASSAALISGPSRTADIEMTLTIGVHGPGEVIVFCLDESA